MLLNNESTGQAYLLKVYEDKFKDVNQIVTMLDTGYSSKEDVWKLFGRFGIKPETSVLILLFERQHENK